MARLPLRGSLAPFIRAAAVALNVGDRSVSPSYPGGPVPDADAIRVPTLTSEFPVVGDDPHIDAPLRATVRRLSTLLGSTLR